MIHAIVPGPGFFPRSERRPSAPLHTLGAKFLVLFLAWLVIMPGHAEEARQAALDLKKAQKELSDLEAKAKANKILEDEVGELIQQGIRLRRQFNECVSIVTTERAAVQAALASVTEGLSEEGIAASAEVKTLRGQISKIETRGTECRLLVVRTDDLIGQLSTLRQRYLREHLLHRDKNAYDLMMESLSEPEQWWESGKQVVIEHSGIKQISGRHFLFMGLVTVLAFLAGFRLKFVVFRLGTLLQEKTFPAKLLKSIVLTTACDLPRLFPLAALGSYLTILSYEVTPTPFVNLLVYAMILYVAMIWVARCLLHPPEPAKQVTPWPDDVGRHMVMRIRSLLILLLLGALLILTPLWDHLPEHVNDLARVTVLSLLAINAIWLTWILGRIPDLSGAGHGVRFILIAALAVTLAAEWLGFRNLSEHLFGGISGTTLAGISFWLASKLLRETFDGFDTGGASPWQRKLRSRMGLKSTENIPGLMWLRLIVGLMLWGGLILVLLRTWGMSDAGMALILQYLMGGFEIAGTAIVPSKVMLGLLIFALLLTLSRWVSGVVDKKAAIRQRLDSGAREALVTIIGYTGFIIALLSGLSLAGVDFSRIAIVAGALSVGIGFGLQNIVNNFMSGLILLFERPVRVGDWVVVGETQGYVRKISVRSTQIQTFDRSDVIVPNGDLISTQVTNWTLTNRQGRLIIPVGVAYGSDTALVKELLLQVAATHPQVVDSEVIGKPKVLFLGFGDSALLFELRCFIWNIADKLDVTSDLNFAIDKTFRGHRVEIPFPQRDVYIRRMVPAETGEPPSAA